MDVTREGEQGQTWKRRTRFYNRGLAWYFHTREGASIGPFDRLSEAVRWASDYVAYIPLAPTLEAVATTDSRRSAA